MSVAWTAERIFALAPDPASAKAGQGLANPRKWVSTGQTERVLWGECQGSGASPYQVQIDLSEPAFKCSCPSRKFPCKHGLALLLMLGPKVPATAGTPPDWVTKWLESRDQQQQTKKEKAEKPAEIADPAAQAKRAAERLNKVAAGIEDLENWVCDLVRTGFAAIPTTDRDKFFSQPAARLVDAQAPGAARLLREMAPLCNAGEGWPARVLDRLSRLYLLTQAFKNLGQLSPETQADVRTLVGLPAKEEEVLTTAPVQDTWFVLGQKTEEEERLRTQRTWLLGQSTQRPALVLEFSFMGQPLKSTLVPGTQFAADVCFYPSALPLRAAIKDRKSETTPLTSPVGRPDITEAVASYGEALSKNPWLERFPLALAEITLTRYANHWFVRDASTAALPLAPRYPKAWELLALSAGRPASLFGEFDGESFLPYSVITQGAFHALV